MDKRVYAYLALILFGVLISAFSQIMLKKAAGKTYTKWYQQYLNPLVIGAYAIFFLSTLTNLIGLEVVPLTWEPIWNSAGHIFVCVLAYLFMRERPGKRKLIGLGLILAGIVLFSLPL